MMILSGNMRAQLSRTVAVALGALLSCGCARAIEGLEWMGSSELRANDQRAASLRAELAGLPAAPGDQGTVQFGWHSSLNPPAPRFIILDLGKVTSFDAVALVPVNVPDGTHSGPGYGFPVRFRVEAMDGPEKGLPTVLADFTEQDFPNPGSLPVVLETPGAQGRYVRVTATKLFTRGEFASFALGELMVLQGQRNVAVQAPVLVSRNYANAPAWQPENLTDGFTVMGPPLHREVVPSHGYHSEIAKDEATTKWVQLDFGTAVPVDEIRLYPARPNDFPPRSGFGFPLRFRVEVCDQAEFVAPDILFSSSERDFSNPGENALIIPAFGLNVRYVRVTATRLWRRNNDYVFALAEMEVVSGGRNIAPEGKVGTLDHVEVSGWTVRGVNDGFTSQGRLRPMADWLRGLSRRRVVEQEIAALDAGRPALAREAWRRLGMWTGWVLGTLALVFVYLAWLRRRRYARDLSRLRRRIAADLHDEIGSNLGSITLLARLAADQQNGEGRADLTDIQRIAQETADSMRDIVWLIQPGPRDARDLLVRMREAAAQSLAGLEWSFEAPGSFGPFSLEFERQVFLLYKEALNNIRKHARARRVTIGAAQQSGEFVLTIVDDGSGFEPSVAVNGHGLASMRHRAGQIGAKLALHTKPEEGTRLELRAHLP
jgi:signal transduction histidine kinase